MYRVKVYTQVKNSSVMSGLLPKRDGERKEKLELSQRPQPKLKFVSNEANSIMPTSQI